MQITGEPGAGKTELSQYLVAKHGFTSVLVSDLIRAYAQPRQLVLRDRSDYKHAHTQLLSELGPFAICDMILGTASDLICVDGIRVPAHVKKLQSDGSKVIALHCPPQIRFARASQRQGELDKANYQDFLYDESLEARNPDPFVQSTLTVMEMADYHVDSSRPLTEVLKEVDRLLATDFAL